MTDLKLLFVCSRGKKRSRTAAELLAGIPGYAARSAGTEPGARVRVTPGLIGWADHLFVMEKKHVAYLRDRFPDCVEGKAIHCLHIPDDFEFMEPALVDLLRQRLAGHLDLPGPG